MQRLVERWARKYFPYIEFRRHQLEAIEFAFKVFMTGKIGLLSSPCGTGKSISVLTAYLMAREVEDIGKLFILTRTRNELEIYARELQTISSKSPTRLRATMLISRQEMCPIARERQEIGSMDYRSFLAYCSRRKKSSGLPCPYYSRTFMDWRPSKEALMILEEIGIKSVLMPDEFYDEAYSHDMCPYELMRIAVADSDVIVGNYNHFLIEEARRSIFARGRMQMGSVNVVLDEAHSLPSVAAGLLSDEISTRTISIARKEVHKYRVKDGGLVKMFQGFVERLGEEARRLVGLGENHVLREEEHSITKNVHLTREDLNEILEKVLDEVDKILSLKMEADKPPISHLGRVAEFIQRWNSEDLEDTVRYVRIEEHNAKKIVRLGISSMDVSRITQVLNRVRSALLMSGTLWDFEYYRDVLGLDGFRLATLSLPSPFKRENRLILVDKGVTTKYELREGMLDRITERLNWIIESVDGRIAVYFPSYELMEKVLAKLKIDIPLMKEDAKTKVRDVLRFLGKNDRCVAMGVARGKISEGVDLTSEGSSLLSAIIVVGLPYPKRDEMHEALLKYYERRFKEKAFEYASTVPCVVALAQMAGRLIRSQGDMGAIVIMDSRIYGRIREKLPLDWKEDMRSYLKIENLARDIRSFLPGIPK